MDQKYANLKMMKLIKLYLLIPLVIILVPVFSLKAEDSSDELHEKINMEEMKIKGKFDKPNIMYIIPRANLSVDMVISDEYFLPLSSESDEKPAQRNETFLTRKALLFHFSKSFSHVNNQDTKKGSCISCHYYEMNLSKSLIKQSVKEELNQICLQCHSVRYYHIGWKEMEKMISDFGQPQDSKAEVKDMVLSKAVCGECHPGWMQSKGKETYKSDMIMWQREYNTDKFCKICHKSKVY